MAGRGRELVDVDIACVQEARWKGNCARQLGSDYKIIYAGCSTRNGVGVILSAEYAKKVTKADRFSDRLTLVQVVYNGNIWNIISAYAPQVGLSPQEKEEFLESLETVLEAIPVEEKVIIGGDFNAHLGKTNLGYLNEHGQLGYGTTNAGERLLDIMQAFELYAVNSGFKEWTKQHTN